jgi:hypothetical protein
VNGFHESNSAAGSIDRRVLLPAVRAAGDGSADVRGLRVADLPALRRGAGADRRVGYWLIRTLPWALLILLAGCSSHRAQQEATGIAYAGPTLLNLRKDLASKSQNVGSAKHGEKLEVLETRRRFVRVRTPAGIEGWTDTNLLLTQQQMDDLHRLAESVAKLPSQGAATVFDTLNMHAEPSRQSPSFFQIPESGSVEVIGHRIAPKYPPAAAPPAVHHAAPAPKKGKGKNAKSTTPPPPTPRPPAPPRNWEALSRPRSTDLPGYIPPAARANATVFEDWSLVRMKEARELDTKTGRKADLKVGWVLSGMLLMSIPDEVAQYAEGHRITSYVTLGEIKDKERNEVKPNWLWTTQSVSHVPYEFDSFRVFVWSTRRHRYETAYIERNIKGFYPVETQSMPGQDEKSFSLVLQDKDGNIYKRTYGFAGYRVRMISKTPYRSAAALPEGRGTHSFDADPVAPPAESSWGDKLRDWRKRWFGR